MNIIENNPLNSFSERIFIRKKEFKKGIDADDLRRERGDEAYQIRKQKRVETLTKRRNVHKIVKQKPDITIQHDINVLSQSVQKLYNNDPTVVLNELRFLRKKMSLSNPPIQ